MKYIKAIVICMLFTALGIKAHWFFYLPAIFVLCVILSAALTPSIPDEDNHTSEPK